MNKIEIATNLVGSLYLMPIEKILTIDSTLIDISSGRSMYSYTRHNPILGVQLRILDNLKSMYDDHLFRTEAKVHWRYANNKISVRIFADGGLFSK